MLCLVLVIRFLSSVPSLNKEGRDSKVKLIDFYVIKPFISTTKSVCVNAVVMKYRLPSKEQ